MNINILIALSLISLSLNRAYAFDLDMTVDDEIRKNYNSEKLIKDTNTQTEENLPALPEISKYQQEVSKEAAKEVYTPPPVINTGTVKIRSGSSFNVVNSTKISDWMRKGATVKLKAFIPSFSNLMSATSPLTASITPSPNLLCLTFTPAINSLKSFFKLGLGTEL